MAGAGGAGGSVVAVCGNGSVEGAEACDDMGESATCNDDCTLAECGDGVLNVTAGEECDDGNTMDGDGCDSNCQLPPAALFNGTYFYQAFAGNFSVPSGYTWWGDLTADGVSEITGGTLWWNDGAGGIFTGSAPAISYTVDGARRMVWPGGGAFNLEGGIAADGSVVWLHDLVAVDRQDGQPTMLRGFMIDITSRKRAEAERIEAESEALEHRERLAHLSRVNMLGEMATGIAHEVNQPLTAVSTYTQACRRMIEAGLIDEDQIIDVLSRISEEAVRAGDMIHGLKALVRKRSSELRVCNVNDLVREVIPLAEVEARPLGIELRLRLAEDLPDILADEVQIQQVVLNLIRNAIEATTAATGSVQVDTARVEGDMIEVAVGDHGTGVTDTDPEQVFQPFFSTKQEGMGMGLSISRSIIEAHGGQIAYRSREGRGSTFFFRLPAEQQLTASAR